MKNAVPAEGGLRLKGIGKVSQPGAPLISIITVVYNAEIHLAQAIQSLSNQSYRNFEYIIIDGGSTDGTLEIINQFGDRIDYWISECDYGIYHAMNKGIDLAHGELIGLLNADDFFEPEALQSVADAYQKTKVSGIYGGHAYVLQEDLGLRYRFFARDDFWCGMPFVHQAMFVHRSVYGRVGTYDRHYQFAADYDFLLRALQQKVKIIKVNSFLVCYRNTGFSARFRRQSLCELRRINRIYFSVWSREYLKFNVSFFRSILLLAAQKFIEFCFGKRILVRTKIFYFRKFIDQEIEF